MKCESNLPTSEIIASAYTKYGPDMKRYFLSYTHDMMQAEDMLQELFLKVLGLDVIVGETIRNLLIVMAHRMIIDDARHKAYARLRERQLRESLSWYESGSVYRKIERDEIARFEHEKLLSMAPKRARVYHLFHHREMTAREIAGLLNLSQRTVEAHIYLSNKEMKQYLRNII